MVKTYMKGEEIKIAMKKIKGITIGLEGSSDFKNRLLIPTVPITINKVPKNTNNLEIWVTTVNLRLFMITMA